MSEWIPSRPIVGFNADGSPVTVDSWNGLPSARLRLTDAEREAVERAIGWIESPGVEDEAMPEDYLPITGTLRGLLERTAQNKTDGYVE